MTAPGPRISIGMPVYNDEPFVGPAIEAILAQDFADFELIVSDNASTDGTSETCDAYARKDRRIRYRRQDRNLGAVRNFNHVFEQGRSAYFAWAGGHDVMQPGMLAACARVLDEEPQVALAYSSIRIIDREGALVARDFPTEIDTRTDSVSRRVRRIILELVSCHMLYGLFRRSALERCRHGIICRGPDHVLLMELSLYGAIANVPAELLHQRENRRPQDEGPSYADYMRGQFLRLDPDAFKRGPLRPHWRWGQEHVRGLWASAIPLSQKVALMPVVVQSFGQRWRPFLSEEVFRPLAES